MTLDTKPCKTCGVPIKWTFKDGKPVPLNIDGTLHKPTCKKPVPVEPIEGQLKSYTTGSATFLLPDGSTHTYALFPQTEMEWNDNKFREILKEGPDIYLKITLDNQMFIKTYDIMLDKPAWAHTIPAQQEEQLHRASTENKRPEAPPVAPGGTSQPDQGNVPELVQNAGNGRDEIQEFKDLLLATYRTRMLELIEWLESTDFFIAPGSAKYHNTEVGGLLHHSMQVRRNLIALNKLFEGDYPECSLTIIALLHDVCKANFYKISTRNVKKEDESGFGIWVKEPYIDIDDQMPLGHGEKSVMLIQKFIKLTDIELFGIRWHMMSYDDLHYSYAGNIAITGASSKYPIIPLVHMADLSASFLKLKEGDIL